jgi:probable phosphoglycerate mutase
MGEIVAVRHGATEWTTTGRHTSRTDLGLTDEGRRQAVSISQRLQTWSFVLVLTSPMRRAYDTCRLAGMGNGVEVDENLREWDYGEYEGRTTAEIRDHRPGWTLFQHGVPGGETVDQVGRRADAVIQRCIASDGTVALFAHGHFLRVLAARWLGLPADHGRLFVLDVATVSVLGHDLETRAVRSWNT